MRRHVTRGTVVCWRLVGAVWLICPAMTAWAQAEPEEGTARERLSQILKEPLFQRWKIRQLRAQEGSGEGGGVSAYLPSTDWLAEVWEKFWDSLFGQPSAGVPSSVSSAGPVDLSGLFYMIAVLICVVAVIVLIVLVAHLLARRQHYSSGSTRSGSLNEALVEGDALAAESSVWLGQASALAQGEDLRLAFRALYLALLSGLHDSGLIRFRRQATNWMYVRGYRGSEEERLLFSTITDRFDRVWYGKQILDVAVFDEARQEVARLLEPTGEGDASSR